MSPVIALLALAPAALPLPGGSQNLARPAVIVTLRNLAPQAGTFQTPVWVGFHDGSFDSYDGGAMASVLPRAGSEGIERLAEDGITDSPTLDNITADFATLVPAGVQGTVLSNGASPPLAPGEVVSRLFEIDPSVNRYFSYVSMVIPSNDAFIANGNPLAHPLFDVSDEFIAGGFSVAGSAVNDAGTELNDEVPANTAFFGQAAPNVGVTTQDPIAAHAGFLPPGSGGILDDPMFAGADFLASDYEMLGVEFRLVDRAGIRMFRSTLGPDQEVADPPVESFGQGIARLRFLGSEDRLQLVVRFQRMSGPLTAAHLHVGPAGQNGSVVIDVTSQISATGPRSGVIVADLTPAGVVGPLMAADDAFGALLAELVTENTYLNLHTAAFPAGEIRGQVTNF
jgi:hypothetical protein